MTLRFLLGYSTASWVTSPQMAEFGTIDATGEKLAICGRFWHPDGPGSYDITRVHFRWGFTFVKTGGSAFTLSLQDVDLTAGAPMRPDGTQDETVAVPNSAVTANTWYRTNALSADRTVAFGDLLSAVLEFDGSGRLGSDTYRLSCVAGYADNTCACLLYNGTSWVLQGNAHPNILFECTDGTFGTFFSHYGHIPTKGLNLVQYHSGSTPDEYALAFTPDYTMTIEGVNGLISNSAAAPFDIIIYEAGTAIYTHSVDPETLRLNDNLAGSFIFADNVTLQAGVQYYIAQKSTSTSLVRWCNADLYSAEVMRVCKWPTSTGQVTRTDGGSWSAIDHTKLPMVALMVCDVAGTGGSPKPSHPFSQKVIL